MAGQLVGDGQAAAPLDQDEVELADAVESDDYPYSIVPDWVLLAPVSDLAVRIYGLLRAYANKSSGGRTSFPAKTTLAKILGYAKTQPIGAAVRELEDIGAVTTREVSCRGGRRTVYKTYLEPVPGAGLRGPRMTSELRAPGVLEEMAGQRAKRRRGRPAPAPTDEPAAPVPAAPADGGSPPPSVTAAAEPAPDAETAPVPPVPAVTRPAVHMPSTGPAPQRSSPVPRPPRRDLPAATATAVDYRGRHRSNQPELGRSAVDRSTEQRYSTGRDP